MTWKLKSYCWGQTEWKFSLYLNREKSFFDCLLFNVCALCWWTCCSVCNRVCVCVCVICFYSTEESNSQIRIQEGDLRSQEQQDCRWETGCSVIINKDELWKCYRMWTLLAPTFCRYTCWKSWSDFCFLTYLFSVCVLI